MAINKESDLHFAFKAIAVARDMEIKALRSTGTREIIMVFVISDS